jgi:hypothetical protein
MGDSANKTTVVLLSSLHLDEATAPVFLEEYRLVLREIAPSVICAELSPEQLAGTTTCKSKPEYEAAVLPVARELDARVVPIQMPTKDALAWQARMQDFHQRLRLTPQGRFYLAYSEALEKAQLEGMLQVARRRGGMEYLQLREHDWLQVGPTYAAMATLLPELFTLHEEWNLSFLSRIEEALGEYAGERFVITVGGYHRYWLWNRLSTRDGVSVHNLQSYRGARSESGR